MKAPVQLLAVIDANSSGVSGDKYLGALLNMGGRVESLRKVARDVAEYLPGTSRVEVEARKGERGGDAGHLFPTKTHGEKPGRQGHAKPQPAGKKAHKPRDPRPPGQ